MARRREGGVIDEVDARQRVEAELARWRQAVVVEGEVAEDFARGGDWTCYQRRVIPNLSTWTTVTPY